MQQEELNFIRIAMIEKMNKMLTEIVDNSIVVQASKSEQKQTKTKTTKKENE